MKKLSCFLLITTIVATPVLALQKEYAKLTFGMTITQSIATMGKLTTQVSFTTQTYTWTDKTESVEVVFKLSGNSKKALTFGRVGVSKNLEERYKKLKLSMNLEEVQKIMGSKGKSNSSNQQTDITWKSQKDTAFASFVDGKLASMSLVSGK